MCGNFGGLDVSNIIKFTEIQKSSQIADKELLMSEFPFLFYLFFMFFFIGGNFKIVRRKAQENTTLNFWVFSHRVNMLQVVRI